MRLRTTLLSLGLTAALCASALGAGCSGDDDKNANTSGDDGGGSDGAVHADPAPYGLDERPSNTTCKAPARPPTTASVKLQQVFANVNVGNPMVMAQLPNDNSRWYVADRAGRIISFPVQNPPNAPREDLNITDQMTLTDAGSEGGLLGMAFHPNFAQNGYVYLSYTTTGTKTDNRSVIGRFTSAAKNGTAFGAQKEVLFFDQTVAGNHKAGCLRFGPKDGDLYATFGDGGGAGGTYHNGQETTTFFGKLLRIDVNKTDINGAYGIPNDNPFKNDTTGKKKEVFAYGFRNPFRFSLDHESGDVWVGDVGQDQWEEVDIVQSGLNYGWNIKEGTHCYPPDKTSCSSAGLTDPIYEYKHNGGRAITGGVVYRGKAIPELVGSYLFGDSSSGEVWSLVRDPVTRKPIVTKIADSGGSPVSFNEGNDGEVYIADVGGRILKVVPNPRPEPSGAQFPEKLSQTGCVDPNNPKNPSPGLIPYGVNSPLWSDGAEKERYLALPDTQKIHIGTDGDFTLPVGTVLVKTFIIGGKRVETRLLVHHDDGEWGGYSYEWNDDETDATLLAANKTKPVGNQTWYYPSRSDCTSCHTIAAGRSLGLELGQQNGDFVYASTKRLSNQLATFDHIGLFDAPLPGAPDTLTKYPTPTSDGDLSDRAFSYLHSNCSFCHRPNGVGGGGDFRYSTPFAGKNVCNANPANGDLGVAGAKVVTPGAPEKSVLSLRVHALDGKRMPPLASHVVDDADVTVLDNWIKSLTSCTPPDAGHN